MDLSRAAFRTLSFLACLLVAQEVEATFGMHVKNVGEDNVTIFVVWRRPAPYTGAWTAVFNHSLTPDQERHVGFNYSSDYQMQIGDDIGTPNSNYYPPTIISAFSMGGTPVIFEINGVAEPETLYYEACQENPGDVPARAIWKLNGAIVFEVYIPPGGSQCYTFEYTEEDTIQFGIEGIQYLQGDDGLIIAKDEGLVDGNPLDGTTDPESPFSNTNVFNLPPRNPYDTADDPRIQNVITFDPADTTDDILKKGLGGILSSGQANDERLLEEAIRIRSATEFMTNSVGNLPDPEEPGVHNDKATAEAAATAAFSAASATVEDLTSTIDIPGGSVGSQGLTTSILLANGMTFNANPLGNSTVASVANAMRTISTWLVAIIVSMVLLKSIQESFNAVIQVPQGTTVGQSFAGFNASLPSALVVAAIIIVVIAGALVVSVSYFVTLFPTFDPIAQFASGGTVQAAAMYWADSIFDMRAALAGIVAIIIGKITIMVTTGLQASVIRLLTGV